MPVPSQTALRRWLVPGLALALLPVTLLFFFGFESDGSQARQTLGQSVWTICVLSGSMSQEYSYCLFVPFVVAFLIWSQRARLAAIPVHGSAAGLAWTLAGLVLFWIGSRAGKQYMGFAGIQTVLAGGIIWFWGPRIFRQLLFPWGIFAFFWPVLVLDSVVAFPLRLNTSRLSDHFLNLIGVPCIESGTALLSAPNPAAHLGLGDRFRIDIADPCSGMHSLLALLLLSALYGHFCLPRRWQKWIVFIAAIPLAVIGNVVRIFMLVAGSLLWGSAFAVGTDETPSAYHEAAGFAVIAIVLVMEYLLGMLLIAVERHRNRPAASTPATPRASRAPGETAVPVSRSAVFAGLALLMAAIGWLTPPLAFAPESGVVMALPGEVPMNADGADKFYGFPAPVTDVERNLLPKDTEFARNNYTDFRGHNIFFSIVLSGLVQFTEHRPEVCLVGQGWVIDGYRDVPIMLDSGRILRVRNLFIHRQLVLPDGETRRIDADHMSWYVTDGLATPSYFQRDWATVWDRVFQNRDHRWAYVAVMSTITKQERLNGLDSEQTIRLLGDFIRRILPSVQKSEMPPG